MKKTLAIISLLTVTTASGAFANDDMMMEKMKMMCDKHMKMMDTNNDGMISKEENMKGAEEMFNKTDTNNDGMVSKDEMMAMHDKEMKDMGMKDKDGMMMKKDSMMKKDMSK